jgi:hypothetical protein
MAFCHVDSGTEPGGKPRPQPLIAVSVPVSAGRVMRNTMAIPAPSRRSKLCLTLRGKLTKRVAIDRPSQGCKTFKNQARVLKGLFYKPLQEEVT